MKARRHDLTGEKAALNERLGRRSARLNDRGGQGRAASAPRGLVVRCGHGGVEGPVCCVRCEREAIVLADLCRCSPWPCRQHAAEAAELADVRRAVQLGLGLGAK